MRPSYAFPHNSDQLSVGPLARLRAGLLAAPIVGLMLGLSMWAPASDAGGRIDLPDFGDSAGAIISPEQEVRIGEQFMREVRRRAPLVTDPELNAYIQTLGDSLTEHVDYHHGFTFFLIDRDEVNAFAVPGGFVGVHTGLILNSEDEGEVASVLAHEVVHVTQRHSIRGFEAQQNMTIPSIVGMLGAVMLTAVNPQAGTAALAGLQAMQVQSQLNFTRANEQEADRIGIRLLSEADYEPEAMARFFERLKSANRYNDPGYVPEYLRTHPVTINRIAEARDRAARMPANPRESSLDYQHAWAKIKAYSYDQPPAAVRYFETRISEQSYRHPEAARYGLAIALMRAGQPERAIALVEQLLNTHPNYVSYYLLAADIARDVGDFALARTMYEQALLRSEDNRAAIYGLADLLTKTGDPAHARRLLRDFSFRQTPDLPYYRLLANAEGETGDTHAARLTMAEYYFHAGEFELARQQLSELRAGQLEPYQRARIEARLDEIEQLMSLEFNG